ncbi:arginine/ornithine antiporter [Escherichia coli]|uniref:Arginine/ornithine antiporter n=1 Tax=Escherichia coli TaxID=562 RepID=A0A376U9U4_ECOLX|nr:arginine/ornithine antiporter [Escherichia coli]
MIVHFLILRGGETAAALTWWRHWPKLLPLVCLLCWRDDVQTGIPQGSTSPDFTWRTRVGAGEKHHADHPVGFIGVEGAVVVSARARNKRDVGKATLLAVLSALGVYLLVTLLSLGVVARPELAEIRNPSMAGLMVEMMGPWGEIIIAAGLIVSVCGAYLSWTIMAAEVPFLAATHKAFPRIFARQNAQAAPSASLWLTNICVQICLVLIWLTGSDYNTLLTIASEMILVPYFLVGAFLLKIATRPLHKAVGVGACIYGLWLLYASGPMHLLLSVVLYAPGLLVFLYARKTHTHDNVLNRQEMVLIGMLLIASVPATWMLVG